MYMPVRNIVKQFQANGYYHVYNRGAAQRKIFREPDDYTYFLKLFNRHLSQAPFVNSLGYEYPWYKNTISLNAFCLMPNHFHLLVYQIEPRSMINLQRSICTAYSMYFNRKYKLKGHVFEGAYKAVLINDESYLLHVTRYIHMNPRDFQSWQYSSLKYYLNNSSPSWVQIVQIKNLYGSTDYLQFLTDYQAQHHELKLLKKYFLLD